MTRYRTLSKIKGGFGFHFFYFVGAVERKIPAPSLYLFFAVLVRYIHLSILLGQLVDLL